MRGTLITSMLVCSISLLAAPDAGAEIYVIGRISDNVVVFDNSGVFLRSVALPAGSGEAEDIALAPSGDFFVLRNGGSVHRFDANLNLIETWSSFGSAYGINVDESGFVYVAGSGSASVSVYSAGGVLQTTLTPAGGSNLRDTVRVAGNTWISNFTGSKLDILDGSGTDIGDVSAPFAPFGMQLAPNGDVWVVDQNDHTVRRFTPAGTQAFSFDADDGPNGAIADQLRYVGVAADGTLYIPRRNETRVDVYSDSGLHLSTLSHASLSGPDGIIATGTAPQVEAIPALGAFGALLLAGLIAFCGWVVATRSRLF
jgi:streptogramin lyase